ncbi:CBS domain-containing protein [Parashewanella curva]|uniref:CBS domain-containing protein n=1 Tax=Parashewanella curva TaxID=2338552 RepID=A0A3L8PTB2_9GAMM|nr:CBS domain-containing protein [Parashewanella curva]RLV58645.1 CBS domain-containing protein [Parashewanella curva]
MSSPVVTNKSVMTQNFAMVDGLKTVSEAIEIAMANKVEVLFVNKRHENDEYGMLLMSDIASKVVAQDKAADRVNVYEIMTKPVVFVRPDMDIRYTARLFDSLGITRSPVIENQDILGLITYNDIVFKGMLNKS